MPHFVNSNSIKPKSEVGKELEQITDKEREELKRGYAASWPQWKFLGVIKGSRTDSSFQCLLEKDGVTKVSHVMWQTGTAKRDKC